MAASEDPKPAVASPLGLFHQEVVRQRELLLEAERRDEVNHGRGRHRYGSIGALHVRQQRLANNLRRGGSQAKCLDLFRSAVQSVRDDGTATVMLPLLRSTIEQHKNLLGLVAEGMATSNHKDETMEEVCSCYGCYRQIVTRGDNCSNACGQTASGI